MKSKSPPKQQSSAVPRLPDKNRQVLSNHLPFVDQMSRTHWVLLAGILFPFGDWKIKLAAFGINLLAMIIIYSITHLHKLGM